MESLALDSWSIENLLTTALDIWYAKLRIFGKVYFSDGSKTNDVY